MARRIDGDGEDDLPALIAPTSTIAFPRRFTNYIPIELRGPQIFPRAAVPRARGGTALVLLNTILGSLISIGRARAPPARGPRILSLPVYIDTLGAEEPPRKEERSLVPRSRNAFNLPRFGAQKASAAASLSASLSSPSSLSFFLRRRRFLFVSPLSLSFPPLQRAGPLPARVDCNKIWMLKKEGG